MPECHHPRCHEPSLTLAAGPCFTHALARIDRELAYWSDRRDWVLARRSGQLDLLDGAA